ncbi:MAG: hypothetical protein WCW04_01675 [Candidatus Paceibacterota bacterium]
MENFKTHAKFNHLEEGFKPIQSCIHNKNMGENSLFLKNRNNWKSFEDVDYSAYGDYYKLNGMLNGGYETYVISSVSSKDKFTKGLYDCTGCIVVGEDKETNENISILSHQDPKQFLKSHLIDSFKLHLSENLIKILQKSKKGSIDAIIYGGQKYGSDFEKSVEVVSEIIKNELGFSPTVITGPKEGNGSTDVYFDNKNRRVYLFIPEQKNNSTLEDFQPEDMINKI